MELNHEFQETDLGTIPSDWSLKPLGDIGEALIGLTYAPSDVAHDGILVLRSSNVHDGRLRFEDNVFVKKAVPERIMVKEGDILICVRNGSRNLIGKAALLDEQAKGMTFGAFMAVFRTSDARFIYHQITSDLVKRQIHEHLGATINQITNKSLNSFRVPFPENEYERVNIAAALSDVDALLGALDRLIAKKRDLKQAAMQQLLAGQTRLPGFTGKWETATLGALGNWLSGGTPSKLNETYWSGDIPWVSPKDMKVARIVDALDHVGQTAIGNGTRLLPAGAILIVVRGMILAHSAPIARTERPVAFNQDIKGLVVHPDVDSNFVLWWLVAHEALLLSITNEATHGTKRIPTDELLKLKLRVPALDEQAAVASVITDMDAELTALEQRRDKTRLLKQGMMQELLTGRTRLV